LLAHHAPQPQPTAGAKKTTSFSFLNYLSANSPSEPTLNGGD
jgi:hypothetical protein